VRSAKPLEVGGEIFGEGTDITPRGFCFHGRDELPSSEARNGDVADEASLRGQCLQHLPAERGHTDVIAARRFDAKCPSPKPNHAPVRVETQGPLGARTLGNCEAENPRRCPGEKLVNRRVGEDVGVPDDDRRRTEEPASTRDATRCATNLGFVNQMNFHREAIDFSWKNFGKVMRIHHDLRKARLEETLGDVRR